jgi:hypothetical protein
MLTYGDCIFYVKKVYDVLNGKINNIAPAIRLALTEPNPDVAKKIEIVGSQCMLYIEIRLDSVFEKFNYLELTDNEIRGGLLFIVAHELSHCNQKIIPNRHNDVDYTRYIEYSNNINTINYLSKYENVLQEYLGPYEVPDIVLQAYYLQRNYYNGEQIIFPYISSVKEKVLDGLSILTKEDVYKTKYPLVDNINMEVYIQNRMHKSFNIIRNKQLTIDPADIIKMSQFIARGIYDYSGYSSISGDTYTACINLNSAPVYNVTVLR